METSLLTTKLYIPPARANLVDRPRLLETLQSSLKYSLVLVSAPAGFGKTTLVSEWVRQLQAPVRTAWLSLEEGDNDPVRFWEYCIAALQTLQPKAGETALSYLHSTQPLPIESTLTVLINDLTPIPEDFILILEDYHFIKSQAVHSGLTFLLEHLPPKMHLVIATRTDPPLPLAHLRGKGTLLEISSDDLRFTHAEASSLLKVLNSPDLSTGDLEALHARTEGWAVGLKMAFLSLKGEKDIPGFIADFTGSQRHIMDYLIEEVLKQARPEIYDFLLQTSILEKLGGPLCDFVTGGNKGQEILGSLVKENLFIVPLDRSQEWYRYEHLFGELLRHRLELESGVDRVKDLHLKASRWYQENGFLEDAIHHASVALDWKRVINLLSTPDALARHGPKLYEYLRSIPDELLLTDQLLYSRYIWAQVIIGHYSTAESCLKKLEQATPDNIAIQGRIAGIRTAIAVDQGDSTRAEEYGKKALSLLLPNNPDCLQARAAACEYLGINYMNKQHYSEAEPLLREACEYYRRAGRTDQTPSVLIELGEITMMQDKLHHAFSIFQQAIETAGKTGTAAFAHQKLSWLYYEWNDLAAAISQLERAHELWRLGGSLVSDQPCHNLMTKTLLAQGDIQGAAGALEKADIALAKFGGSPFDQARNAWCHVMFSVAQEDREATSEWVEKLTDVEAYIPLEIRSAVRPLFARKGKTAAIERHQADYQRFMSQGLKHPAISARLCQALECETPAGALDYLAEALAMGRPEGLIRMFVDQGMSLAPLLHKAFSQGIEPEYAGKLLTIIEAEERQRQIRKGIIKSSGPTAGLLSERELEVLRLLAKGFSNEQIAVKMVISLSTAKTHVHHIFEKLNAEDRLHAVNRAKDLQLI